VCLDASGPTPRRAHRTHGRDSETLHGASNSKSSSVPRESVRAAVVAFECSLRENRTNGASIVEEEEEEEESNDDDREAVGDGDGRCKDECLSLVGAAEGGSDLLLLEGLRAGFDLDLAFSRFSDAMRALKYSD